MFLARIRIISRNCIISRLMHTISMRTTVTLDDDAYEVAMLCAKGKESHWVQPSASLCARVRKRGLRSRRLHRGSRGYPMGCLSLPARAESLPTKWSKRPWKRTTIEQAEISARRECFDRSYRAKACSFWNCDEVVWCSRPRLGALRVFRGWLSSVAMNPKLGSYSLEEATNVLTSLINRPGYRYWPIEANWTSIPRPSREGSSGTANYRCLSARTRREGRRSPRHSG